MPEPLSVALAEVRTLLTDPNRLVRAVAAGHRRNERPRWVRATLRPVALTAGARLQLVTDDGIRPTTRNLAWGEEATSAVDTLLAEPFANWHVLAVDRTVQLRVTKRGEAQVHRAGPALTGLEDPGAPAADTAHDRAPEHLLDPGDALFDVIGGSAAKRRQVDAFLRALTATLGITRTGVTGTGVTGTGVTGTGVTGPAGGGVGPRAPTPLPNPLRVADLGCGNAYLTFAAYRFLSGLPGAHVELVGVDIREDQRVRNTELARRLGWDERVRFVAASIAEASLDAPDVVLALHACDTATDEALARAVRLGARWVLAAPCCHHDIATQLRRHSPPPPYDLLTRHAILRERFADVLTDALRAALLRLHGYRVDVVEFVASQHTPRNVLLRADFTGAAASPAQRAEYASLVETWQITPHLAGLLS